MKSAAISTDLFGKPLRKRRSRIETALARYDEQSFPERLERQKWLQRVYPSNYHFLFPPETFFVFREAGQSYVAGHFVGTLMLSAACIEHILTTALQQKGFDKEAKGGMRSILDCLRNQKSPLTPLLAKIDHIQEIRNPFVHLKPSGHPSAIPQRSWRISRSDQEVLEEDAKEALSVMYTVAITNPW